MNNLISNPVIIILIFVLLFIGVLSIFTIFIQPTIDIKHSDTFHIKAITSTNLSL